MCVCVRGWGAARTCKNFLVCFQGFLYKYSLPLEGNPMAIILSVMYARSRLKPSPMYLRFSSETADLHGLNIACV